MSCRLVRGRGKANRSYLQLYVFDGGGFMCVFWFFLCFFFGVVLLFWGFAFFFVLVKEDLEKDLKFL